MAHAPSALFAGLDPAWRTCFLLAWEAFQARRWTHREGPIAGHLQTWAALLPLISAVERGVVSVQQRHAATMPHVLALARIWAGTTADDLRALDLDAALAYALPVVADLR
jgi:hypothetical protein